MFTAKSQSVGDTDRNERSFPDSKDASDEDGERVSRHRLLSVGLPVYNGEKYLEQSIESLLGQSYEDFELIISDNASTDGTADICRRYENQDSRIRYVRQPRNIGLSPNHNFVLQQSRGEYFKWAAADDLYGRDLLKSCVDALDEHADVVLAHAWEAAIDDAGTVTQAMDYPLATDSPRAPDRFKGILFGSSGLFESSDPAVTGLVRVDNRGVLRACDMYGVIRTAALRRVTPLGSYHHADRITMCALTLHGRFHIARDWLYFRRDTPDRTYNKAPKLRDRCEVNDPARKNRLLHPTARLVAEYFWAYIHAIQRAPLSPADRRECYGHLTQWVLDRATSKIVRRPMIPVEAPDYSHTVSVRAVVPGQDKLAKDALVKSAREPGEQPS
jgi:glycosyltransferase involved in cell wall biosynthesis